MQPYSYNCCHRIVYLHIFQYVRIALQPLVLQLHNNTSLYPYDCITIQPCSLCHVALQPLALQLHCHIAISSKAIQLCSLIAVIIAIELYIFISLPYSLIALQPLALQLYNITSLYPYDYIVIQLYSFALQPLALQPYCHSHQSCSHITVQPYSCNCCHRVVYLHSLAIYSCSLIAFAPWLYNNTSLYPYDYIAIQLCRFAIQPYSPRPYSLTAIQPLALQPYSCVAYQLYSLLQNCVSSQLCHISSQSYTAKTVSAMWLHGCVALWLQSPRLYGLWL